MKALISLHIQTADLFMLSLCISSFEAKDAINECVVEEWENHVLFYLSLTNSSVKMDLSSQAQGR